MYLGRMQMLLRSGTELFSHFMQLPTANRPKMDATKNFIFKIISIIFDRL